MEAQPDVTVFCMPTNLLQIQEGQNLFFQKHFDWGFCTLLNQNNESQYLAKGLYNHCPFILAIDKFGKPIDTWCQDGKITRSLSSEEIQGILNSYSKAEIIEEHKIL